MFRSIRVADQKKFEEGIRSYRTRIETELESIRMNLAGFDDIRNSPSSLRILTQYMRRSLDKINSYFHNIEMLVEKGYAESVKSVDEDVEGVPISRGENLQKEST